MKRKINKILCLLFGHSKWTISTEYDKNEKDLYVVCECIRCHKIERE